MTDEIIIPNRNALSKFNLSRFVGSLNSASGSENPFIKVANTDVVPSQVEDENYFMNEVVMEAFEYSPVKITTEDRGGGLVQTKLTYGGGSASSMTVLQKFRILLNSDEDITVKYGTHKWDDSPASMFQGIYDVINDTAAAAAMVGTAVTNAAARFGANQEFKPDTIQRVDYQKIYKNTDYPSFDINFTLFTADNYIEDIFTPLMTLIAYTYPKRITPQTNDKGKDSSLLGQAADTGQAVSQASAKAANDLTEALALSARQYTLKPPCLFNVYHQSGLYSYTNCMCNNMSVKYEGPWYNTSYEEQVAFDGLNKGVKMNVSRRSFPSIAKVNMSFETSERITRDDFSFLQSSFKSIADSGQTTFTSR
jgi:hypothetical protein